MIESTYNNDALMLSESTEHTASCDEAPVRREDDLRTNATISKWQEYLPADCVEAMIKQGWHLRV